VAEPRWLDETEARAWRGFLAAYRELMAEIGGRLMAESGLSAAEYEVLVPLSEAPGDVLRARDLAVAVGWERSRLSHQISRMAKRDLVVREDCEEDARGAMVRLTDAGRAAITAAAPSHVEAVRQYFLDALTSEEVETLGTAFGRLRAALPREKGEQGQERG
jgi:DNA-binding MarR family transcriptional regulator